jgi:hypothetical protein
MEHRLYGKVRVVVPGLAGAYMAENLFQAKLIRGYLETEGIAALVEDEYLYSWFGGSAIPLRAGGIRVLVSRLRWKEAREIVLDRLSADFSQVPEVAEIEGISYSWLGRNWRLLVRLLTLYHLGLLSLFIFWP